MSNRSVGRYVSVGLGVVLSVAFAFGVAGVAGAMGGDTVQQGDASVISYGEQKTAAIDRGDPTALTAPARGDERTGTWYYEPVRFSGSAGDLINATLTARGTDTVLVLENPDGETVAVNDDGGPGDNSRLVYRLEESGEYTLRVTSRDPLTTSAYSLSLSRVADYQPDPTSIGVGEVEIGGVTETDARAAAVDGHHDNLSFDVNRGQRIGVQLDTPARSAVRLYGPTGALIASDVADEPGESAAFVTDLPYGGGYSVTVSTAGDAVPTPYRLAVTDETEEEVTLSQDERQARDRSQTDDTAVEWAALNTTTAYAGTPVRVRAAITNTGGADGQLDWSLLADDERIGQESQAITYTDTEIVTFSGRLDEPGQYTVFVDSTPVGVVTVLPRPEADLSVTANGGTTRGVVTNASAGSTFEVPLAGGESGDATFERLSLGIDESTRRLVVSAGPSAATGDTDEDARTPPLPRGADRLGGLTVSAERAVPPATVGNVTMTFTVGADALADDPETVRMYARGEGVAWTDVRATLVDGSGERYRYRASTDGMGQFAVAAARPVFEVRNVSVGERTVRPGSTVTATATVTNVGQQPGSHAVLLATSNGQFTSESVSLAPEEATTVRFQAGFNESGTYSMYIGNGTEPVTVNVTQGPSNGTTPADSVTATTASTATTTASATATATVTETRAEPAERPGTGAEAPAATSPPPAVVGAASGVLLLSGLLLWWRG